MRLLWHGGGKASRRGRADDLVRGLGGHYFNLAIAKQDIYTHMRMMAQRLIGNDGVCGGAVNGQPAAEVNVRAVPSGGQLLGGGSCRCSGRRRVGGRRADEDGGIELLANHKRLERIRELVAMIGGVQADGLADLAQVPGTFDHVGHAGGAALGQQRACQNHCHEEHHESQQPEMPMPAPAQGRMIQDMAVINNVVHT